MIETDVEIVLYRCPLHSYTFKVKDIREWVEKHCVGKTLNLFAGKTKLNADEIRNDLDTEVEADYHLEALECVKQWNEPTFDTIILDPPYSYRKSMEYYGDRKASTFKIVKDYIPSILKNGGRVITFGYHSISMGKTKGFKPIHVAIFSHGGAIHDTIGTVEIFEKD